MAPIGFAILIFAAWGFTAGSPAAPAPDKPLVRIHYDLELASYCSLVTAAVRDGFKRQLASLIQLYQFSPEEIQSARNEASVAVYREWQNRSLGGFRGWCRNEGAATVRRFSTDTEE